MKVALDSNVLEQIARESYLRAISFRNTLSNLLRVGSLHLEQKSRHRVLKVEPTPMGYRAGLNYNSVESLLEYGEGEWHR